MKEKKEETNERRRNIFLNLQEPFKSGWDVITNAIYKKGLKFFFI